MAELHEGARVRHSGDGREHVVVRRMPPNTAPGHEEEEVEPVYELDDGSLAPHGALVALDHPAAEPASEPAEPVAPAEGAQE